MFTGEALAKYCATGLRELCKAAGETYDPTLISAHQPRERYLHKNSTSIDDDDDDGDDDDVVITAPSTHHTMKIHFNQWRGRGGGI